MHCHQEKWSIHNTGVLGFGKEIGVLKFHGYICMSLYGFEAGGNSGKGVRVVAIFWVWNWGLGRISLIVISKALVVALLVHYSGLLIIYNTSISLFTCKNMRFPLKGTISIQIIFVSVTLISN